MATLVYSINVQSRSAKGLITKAQIVENGSVIGQATRLVSDCWFKVKFSSERAGLRFDDYCDSLSMTETIEALAD